MSVSDWLWRWWCAWAGCRIRYGQCTRCGGLCEEFADGVLPLAFERPHWLRTCLGEVLEWAWRWGFGRRCLHCRRHFWRGHSALFCSEDCDRESIPF